MPTLAFRNRFLLRPIRGRRIDELIKTRVEVWEEDALGNRLSKGSCKDSDMINDNLGKILANLFCAYNAGTLEVSTTVQDTGNASRTFKTVTDSQNFNYHVERGGRIGVGTGAVAPARTDYTLGTQVGSWTAFSADGVWTSAAGTITFAASVLIAAGATVTESGVIWHYRDSTGTRRDILVIRDTFAGVAIAAGKYAHVAYTLQL